jgi:hypothetical protein
VTEHTVAILQSQITGNEIGGIHVKTLGAVNAEFDVPLPQGTAVAHEGGFDLRGLMRGVPNKDANISFALFMDAYAGPGTFKDARAEVIPGAPPSKEDYKRGACTVIVKDEVSGTFDCKSMQNIYDSQKLLDVNGTWRLLPISPTAATRSTVTPASEPTAEPTKAAAPGQTAHVKYQVNLNGAFALSGSLEIAASSDACSVGLGIGVEALTAVSNQRLAGHTLAFVPHTTGISLLLPKPGAYPITTDEPSVILIDDGAQGFSSDGKSSGAVTLNADGSGQFTFNDFKDAAGDKRESGVIVWTCARN